MGARWAQGTLAGRVRGRTPFWDVLGSFAELLGISDVFQGAESCQAGEMSGLRLQGSLQRYHGQGKNPVPCKVPKPVSLGGQGWNGLLL